MTTGAALLAGVPEQASPARDRAILALLKDWAQPLHWFELHRRHGPYVLRCRAACDALMVGSEQPVRINLSHVASDAWARSQSCVLGTPALDDARWAQAQVRIAPRMYHLWSGGRNQSKWQMSTWAMIEHSRAVDRALPVPCPPEVSIANQGKPFVNSVRLWHPHPSPNRACLYGWHGLTYQAQAVTPQGAGVIQQQSLTHVWWFSDYAEPVLVYDNEATVYGPGSASRTVRLSDIAQDQDLGPLVWGPERPLSPLRHPRNDPAVPGADTPYTRSMGAKLGAAAAGAGIAITAAVLVAEGS